MAIQISVTAEVRNTTGKGAARKVRREGKIPAVLYGAKQAPVSLTLNPKDMAAILHSDAGHNSIFELSLDGHKTAAMIVDWQRNPIKGNLLHVDLKRIAMDQRMRVKVPVQAQGEAAGVKQQGGILELVTREVELECLPGAIPEHLTIDVSGLMIGQNFRVADLQVPADVKVTSDPDRVIAHVIAVKETVAAEPAAATTPAEPEVAKKGKAESETEEGKEGKEGKKK